MVYQQVFLRRVSTEDVSGLLIFDDTDGTKSLETYQQRYPKKQHSSHSAGLSLICRYPPKIYMVLYSIF